MHLISSYLLSGRMCYESHLISVISLGRYTSNCERIILANLFPSKQLRDMKGCFLKADIFSRFLIH